MIARNLTGQSQGFSPKITNTLFIEDDEVNVRASCATSIRVEVSKPFPPCTARMRMQVGDEVDEFTVRLLEGIDPTRDEQPIRILSET